MGKKKSKDTPVKDPRGITYPDPCFHCKNLCIQSTGMSCGVESPAFWSTIQGFEEDPKTKKLTGMVCLKFSQLPKPLKPSNGYKD